MVEAIEDDLGFPGALAEFEALYCRCPDGVTVEAEARPDLPWRFLFEGYHPTLGRLFFRLRRRGDGVELWEVTEALGRLLTWRNRRARRGRPKDAAARRRRTLEVRTPAGAPTPERRRRDGGLVRRVMSPAGKDTLVWAAPDVIEGMFKRKALTQRQRDMALYFHGRFIAGCLHPGRAYDLLRPPGPISGTGPAADGVLDAKREVWSIYDHIGGRDTLGARVLYHVAGLDRSIEDCVVIERGKGAKLNRDRAYAVLSTALDGVAGYRATRARYEDKAEGLNAAETITRDQGA